MTGRERLRELCEGASRGARKSSADYDERIGCNVLAPDVTFIGFTAREWTRLLEAVRPEAESMPQSCEVTGGVVLVTQGRKLIKLVHTERGRLDPHLIPWPEALPNVAEGCRARWALHIEFGALKSLFDRFAEQLSPEQTYQAQLLLLLGLFRQYEAEGRVRLWSNSSLVWPVPSARTVDTALDALCPVGKSLLFGVFRRGELYTSIAARRSKKGFDRVVGPSLLRPGMGLLSGDWTRDYRYLLGSAEALLGSVCVGCFGELLTFQGLAGFRRPGAWAEAVAMREVILSPVVPALAIPLGLDVGRAALFGVKSLAERANLSDWLSPERGLGALIGRLHAKSAPGLQAILGFDPLALLYQLLERRTPRE